MTTQSIVLAIDPSLRGTGFAILEGTEATMRCLEYGVISNPPQLTAATCLVTIHKKLTTLITKYHPEAMALENIIYVQSYATAITLGAARGVTLLAGAQAGLPIHEYAPRRVKQAVVGRGGAAKNQVAFMVRALLGLTETPPSDAADAIAVGVTYLRNRTTMNTAASQLPTVRKKKTNVATAWKKYVTEMKHS